MTFWVFFLLHWYLSAFFQTFFLHRYASHQMFTMNKFWERFFYVGTFLTQGSSYLNPRAYAVMHRMHHWHSDTARDPHSPKYFSNPMKMMWNTFFVYRDIADKRIAIDSQYEGGYPEWPAFDRIADSLLMRWLWIAAYLLIYTRLVTDPWQYGLLPITVFMGPVHGAIVNWCGHRYGYQNFDNSDNSKNTLCVDFVCLGELMQNNHHRSQKAYVFSYRKFEWDPVGPFLAAFHRMGIIQMKVGQDALS